MLLLQIRAYARVIDIMNTSNKAAKTHNTILLYFLLVLLPAIVPIVSALVYVQYVLASFGVFMVVNNSKSLAEGFGFMLGLNYR